MPFRSAPNWPALSAALAATLLTATAAAQTKPDKPKAAQEPTTDELIEELLTSEGDSDDLSWLYESDEYAPSDLAGEPIPAPGLPDRGEGTPRTWNPKWKKFTVGNYVLTGVALAISGGSSFIPESPERWRGRFGFDEDVKGAIGVDDYDRSYVPRDVSDLLLSSLVAYPLLIDSLVVTYWYRNSHDVAAQMGLISAEAIAVATAMHGLTAGFASRERPYGRDCGTTIDPDLEDCTTKKRYRSFFSGHTTMSFAAAGVACSHHAHHDVFGDPVADSLACGLAMTGAATVGTMRIVGNQHYFSDVAAGAVVGTLGGLGVPWLLHYGPLARQDDEAAGLTLSIVPSPDGVTLGGTF